jgi:hypothetical protein
MVVGKHAIDTLADKEGRRAVRGLFRCLRQGQTDPAHTRQMFFTGSSGDGSFEGLFSLCGFHFRTKPYHGSTGIKADKNG